MAHRPLPTLDSSSGTCPTVITRTWTATDGCGRTATCDQTITYTNDTTDPVITCPADTTIECDASTDPANTGSATATDNCVTPTVTYADSSSGTCPTVITRTWTATDGCGRTATCDQTITVNDTTDPVITCPADTTIECDESTDPSNTGSATAIDNCSTPAITYSDSSSGTCPTVITRTWTATDGCGRTATCDQTITVNDTTPPEITCPANTTVECDESTNPSNTGSATATDNCDEDLTITYCDSSSGTCPTVITRTWTATDYCDNTATCVQTITVGDTTDPVFTGCPTQDINLGCTTTPPTCDTALAYGVTANDNCDGTITPTCQAGTVTGTECSRSQTFTLTATDSCNNSDTCAVTYTWKVDTTAAVISTTDTSGNLGCNPTVTAPTFTGLDNCEGTITPVITGDGPTNTSGCAWSQTWNANYTDACGNVSDQESITYTWKVDTTDPVLPTLPTGGDLGCNPTTLPSCTEGLTATDNCDTNVTVGCTAGTVGEDGCGRSQTFTYTATDDCGNDTSSGVTYTWKVDTTDPVITCPPNVTIESGESTDPSNTGTATATDNCDPDPEITFSDSITGTDPTVITRTWTATDDCDNFSQCEQTITTTPPTLPPSGSRIPCKTCTMEIDMLGEIAEIDVGCCTNQTLHSYEYSDPDDMHFLLLDGATAVICGETADCGKYPRIIVIREAEDPEEEPENGVFVGPVYDFTGYGRSNWEDPDCPICDTVTFGQAVSVIIGYDPDDLPKDTVMVGIYVFDPELGRWVLSKPIPGFVAGVGQANGLVNHFSQLAVIAELPDESPPSPPETPAASPPTEPAPSPAHFLIGDLTIVPSQARTGIGNAFTFMFRKGESVSITADVSNDGGQGGSYTAALKLNGEVLSSKDIALQPGQSQQVIFTVTEIEPGQYVVQVDNLSGEFESLTWTNWWLIGGLIAGVTLLAWYFGYYRKRHLGPPG